MVAKSARTCGEPAISLHSYHVSLVQWTTRLLPIMRDRGSILRGYFCENRILLLALSRYIGDPNVIDHCGLVWGGLRPELSLGLRADNVIIPLDLPQLFCPGFTLAAGPPSAFTTDIVGCCEGALWRACNLIAFIHSLTGPVGQPFTSVTRDLGSIPRGVLKWIWDSPVSVVSLQTFIIGALYFLSRFHYSGAHHRQCLAIFKLTNSSL
jgi:hypothetical protein